MSDRHRISPVVNGVRRDCLVESRLTLADYLRTDLRLTGTHLGCEHGSCGACTVLVDGVPLRSCVIFAVQVDECSVVTVEGLAEEDGEMTDLQRNFSRRHGLQCGFCTPGFLTLLHAFLDDEPDPDDEQIRDVVAANTCRCTGYAGIRAAVRDTIERRRGGADEHRSGAGGPDR